MLKRHVLSALLPLTVIAALLAPPGAAQAAGAATVSVTRPVADATDPSLVDITATGTVDPASGDVPQRMVLFNGDFMHPDGIIECPSTSTTTCQVTFQKPASDYPPLGALGYFVLFVTQQVQITANPPALPPTVTILSPSGASTITTGTPATDYTVVHAEGSYDGSDFSPYSMDLLVDGAPAGSEPCQLVGDYRDDCAAALQWYAGGLTNGPHTIQVRYNLNTYLSSDILSALSAPETVTVTHAALAPASVALAAGPDVVFGAAGSDGSVHGVVTDAATHQPLAGVPVAVDFAQYAPLNPDLDTEYTTSGPDGKFTAADRYHLYRNTTVTATVDPSRGGASATTTVGVTLPITCTVPSAAHRNLSVTISCSIPFLAPNSVVALHFSAPVPHQTSYGKLDKHGVVTFTTSFSHPQTLRVWATIATTHSFTASRSSDHYLKVG